MDIFLIYTNWDKLPFPTTNKTDPLKAPIIHKIADQVGNYGYIIKSLGLRNAKSMSWLRVFGKERDEQHSVFEM